MGASPEIDPFVGALIGDRYRVIDLIAKGGMGAVYRAEHVLMKKVVALKLLHPDLGQIEEAGKRFEREAQSASRLSHPNIIAVTDFGRAGSGELFLAMEFVPGESLADLLDRGGRLPAGRAVAIARQILLGLEHAHSQGVVHRDLKPGNVMLTTRPDHPGVESVKLLDFGIAKLSQVPEGAEQLTRGAMVFGTPSYMSPEQATAQEADTRSDLYSCGVVLYEMLAGRKPFVANDLIKVMAMHVTSAPPSFADVAADARISPALEAVVMRALEKDRARRFASATEFGSALDRAAGAKHGFAWIANPTSSLGRAWPLVRARMNRLPWPVRRWLPVGGGAAAIVLLLVMVPWLFLRGKDPSSRPPAPLPVESELQVPIRKIEDAMAKAKLTEARILIMQQLSAHPEAARVRYLLGTLEFIQKNPSAGLDAYREALRLDPGLRGDAALLLNVHSALEDRHVGRQALDLLIGAIGRPAADRLAEVASKDRRADFRRAARTACESVGCEKKVDLVNSYLLDLGQGRTCEERREAVKGLGATGDVRAIEPLKKARRERGLLDSLLGAGNECIRKDIDDALRELGET